MTDVFGFVGLMAAVLAVALGCLITGYVAGMRHGRRVERCRSRKAAEVLGRQVPDLMERHGWTPPPSRARALFGTDGEGDRN